MPTQSKKAFTIIEVVLVLAVAGLIFLVVFAAIPRLQSSRRDNARKDHARTLAALVIEYSSNTGSIPTVASFGQMFPDAQAAPSGVLTDYVDDDIIDPSGVQYDWTDSLTGFGEGDLIYYNARECHLNGTTLSVTTNNEDWAIIMGLERGVFCIDSQ